MSLFSEIEKTIERGFRSATERLFGQAESGDLMLFFSDGVEDQLNAKEEDFTRGRVIRLLKKHGTESPKALADAIFADIDTFRDDTAITDDQSIVAIKVH